MKRTPEEQAAYRRQYNKEHSQRYRAEHPERYAKYMIRTSLRTLKKLGLDVRKEMEQIMVEVGMSIISTDELVKALTNNGVQIRYEEGYHDGYQQAMNEIEHKFYNTHEVARIIDDLFGNEYACNFNDISDWLPNYCGGTVKGCTPDIKSVECWERYLQGLKGRKTKHGNT